MATKKVTFIPGDGIGAEVSNASRAVIEALKVPIQWEDRIAGEAAFIKGFETGVPPETIQSALSTRCVLKGPLGTPVGYGNKSANVTLRKLAETYANIRPVREWPNVPTAFKGRGIDITVVRENIEDLYAGVEHQQSPGVAQAIKMISDKGCEKIARFAFEVARAEGRKKVTCATKSNILKMTEGTLKRVFERIAPEYPDIQAEHMIVDNCAHQLAKKPEQFEVILFTNMNGDILSDLTSGLIGGLGFAPSANIGKDIAIFEAVHGSAPKYAGKNNINPTAHMMSAVMMLRYLGFFDAADKMENSIYATYEQGKFLPRDVVGDAKGCKTTDFTQAVIDNLGKKASSIQARNFKEIKIPNVRGDIDFVKVKTRRTAGIDVFVEWAKPAEELAESLNQISGNGAFKLKAVSNRGTQVWPATGAMPDLVDSFCCRFIARNDNANITDNDVVDLLQKLNSKHVWTHIEKLNEFDGKLGYSKAQGES
ncbi:MAG: NADP-dependent isocitrate dehydrogenase [Dongiaceae bacterium]